MKVKKIKQYNHKICAMDTNVKEVLKISINKKRVKSIKNRANEK